MRYFSEGDIVILRNLPLASAIARTIGVKRGYRYTVAEVKQVGSLTAIQLTGVAKRAKGKYWNVRLFRLECSQDH